MTPEMTDIDQSGWTEEERVVHAMALAIPPDPAVTRTWHIAGASFDVTTGGVAIIGNWVVVIGKRPRKHD